MSAIGGIVDFRKKELDFSSFNRMRIAMSLRGRAYSRSFICDGVGMLFNCSAQSDGKEKQPYICERRGKSSSLCIDTEAFGASSVMEKYFVHGTDFLGYLGGAFALALYDGEREILILARDKKGRKPLFYCVRDGRIFFSSEIKGLISSCAGSFEINKRMLEYHLSAPMGVYRATSLYDGACEVLPGECVIFSMMGESRFFYRENSSDKRMSPSKKTLDTEKRATSFYSSLDKGRINEYVNEALIAFDYPQFDCYMPFLMEFLQKNYRHSKKRVVYVDAVRRKNISYAYEREDRLGSHYGVWAVGVMPKEEIQPDPDAVSLIEQVLIHRFFSLSERQKKLLRQAVSEPRLNLFMHIFEQDSTKKEDTEARIRILGMLCQTVEWLSWLQTYSVGLSGKNDGYFFNAL